MPSIEDAIRMIHEFEARIANPIAFYEARRKTWEVYARDITLQTLLHLRPPDAEVETWTAHAHAVASKVTAETFDGSAAAGILFDTRDWSQEIAFTDPDTGPADPTGITVEDIERWVEAGLQGNEGGKDIAQMDSGKTPTQVAWRVYRAILNQRGSWERLLGHIHDFGGMQHAASTDAMAGALAAQWQEALIPAIVADWRDWVAGEVARLG